MGTNDRRKLIQPFLMISSSEIKYLSSCSWLMSVIVFLFVTEVRRGIELGVSDFEIQRTH